MKCYNELTQINRRTFIATSAATAIAGAFAGTIATSASGAEIASEDIETDYASQVTETVDFDIAVVGSGVSGIAAGVEAAQLGLKVISLESAAIRGGVIRSTEGLCAVDSPLQQEQGINTSIPEVIKAESEAVQYRLNGLFWKEMLERSGDNIQWLMDNGVQFTGLVNNYNESGVFPTFHWFPGDHEAQTYYGDPMEAVFNQYADCELRLNTRGRQLKFDGNKVVGLYATTDNGVLEINAKAVILATGGFGGSEEEVAKRYPTMHLGHYACDGALTNCGDGINMILSAGGVDDSVHRCFLGGAQGDAIDSALRSYATNGDTIWINQDGTRIVDESVVGGMLSIPGMNLLFQHDEIYALYDAPMLGDILTEAEEEAMDNNSTGVFCGNTIEELADAIGIDAYVLNETINNYNLMIDNGEDIEFGKDLSQAAKIIEAPFFAFRQIVSAHGNIGGAVVNLKYEVIRWDSSPVDGLYAVGTESNMNYREYAYSFTVPGGAMCQAVDSGRYAAKNAAEYISA